MSRHLSSVCSRLSLRQPQRGSLEILADLVETINPGKSLDLQQALEAVNAAYPSVTSFEDRDFPSLCFALATGVGKTRLMGAFIAYLHLAKGMKNFFVLAPNLTIYNKLIADFTPNTTKYVFQGIAEFAVRPPEIVTGDNYDSGRVARIATREQLGFWGQHEGVHINIFNISKLNSDIKAEGKQGKPPRIKRLKECIGDSYFNYLAQLEDLVLLMDESHRYRADAGVRVLNELKPVLGLELTATPQTEAGAQPKRFKNIIFEYPLSSAIKDGFVKQPAVATRENFNASHYSDEELERIKLEDGVRIHESTKVDLDAYSRQSGERQVKPFILVVARDTDHAKQLIQLIEADTFFEGRYKGKVIEVHSALKGEEKDENVASLLAVEDPRNPTEIVVHVNMLKEGWDVTNLYTIVPLRAANSKTLVEQSIGRGLRLPYGKRTGVASVDRLTIVAHDKFQEIVDESNRPDSQIRIGVVYVGKDIPLERKKNVTVPSVLEQRVAAEPGPTATNDSATPVQPPLFTNDEERKVARVALQVLKKFEYLPSSNDLKTPEVQALIAREVAAQYQVGQGTLDGVVTKPNVAEVVAKTVDTFVGLSIDLPRIVVQPVGEVSSGFRDFDLDPSGVNLQPTDQSILIHHLQSNLRERLNQGGAGIREARLEDYLVAALIDYDDVSYDDHADLLYKLAGQMVAHLHGYLKDEDEVVNVLVTHRARLAEVIHTQMLGHYWEHATAYETKVSKSFQTLQPTHYSTLPGDTSNFRQPVDEKRLIRGMLFEGFRKCLYPQQRFDSDTERLFAVVLEDDGDVLKWFKPARGQFPIYYRSAQAYEPDFVVETTKAKYLCEPKRAIDLATDDVQAKAHAAALWCEAATKHELQNRGKPWHYLLIPHDAIASNMTVAGLAAAHTYQAKALQTQQR